MRRTDQRLMKPEQGRRPATLPWCGIQRENWEFETHKLGPAFKEALAHRGPALVEVVTDVDLI
jgi:thiamine pyrophosphate-dependent acetolactate synthase large subunit-like protein